MCVFDNGQCYAQGGSYYDPNLGEHGGLISILTAGELTRRQYTEQAILCALARTRNPAWYADEGADEGAAPS